jgi:glycine cleavage system aminomethyltransferase T
MNERQFRYDRATSQMVYRHRTERLLKLGWICGRPNQAVGMLYSTYKNRNLNKFIAQAHVPTRWGCEIGVPHR